MKKIKTLITINLLFSIILLSIMISEISRAQGEEESAYIIATIDGDIPPIKPGTWTAINITVIDKSGFNWTYFSQDFLDIPGLRWYGKLLVWVIWPKILFKNYADFFGYNTLFFYPEIVEGNPKGWKLKVIPPSVSPTTDGVVHHIRLYVWADKTAMDYAVTIGIKCIRYSYNGKILGSSYIYIPVKLDKFSYVEMVVDQPRKPIPPWSTSYVTATVTNKGYYEDTFHFTLEVEGGIKGEAKEQQLVLKPGESKKVTFVIFTPRKFLEYGKPYEVKVYTTSYLNPNKTYLGSFVIFIEGFPSNPKAGGFYLIQAFIITISLILILVKSVGIAVRRGKLKIERKEKSGKVVSGEVTYIPTYLSKEELIKRIKREQEKQRRKLRL